MSQLRIRLEIVVEPDDGGFYAHCPSLKGLHAAGATEQEALQNARDAASAYLQSLIKHNDPIPVGIVDSNVREKPLLRKFIEMFAPKPSRHVEEFALAA